MKKIPLTQGKVAIVDDEDFEYLNQWNWCLAKMSRTNEYAMRTIRTPNRVSIFMHRLVLEAKKGEYCDHINGNGLDNRRSNLRICGKKENNINRRKNVNNTTGYKGVCWDKSSKKWKAQVIYKKKYFHLGFFKNKIEAAKAYNEAALKYHREFATLNVL